MVSQGLCDGLSQKEVAATQGGPGVRSPAFGEDCFGACLWPRLIIVCCRKLEEKARKQRLEDRAKARAALSAVRSFPAEYALFSVRSATRLPYRKRLQHLSLRIQTFAARMRSVHLASATLGCAAHRGARSCESGCTWTATQRRRSRRTRRPRAPHRRRTACSSTRPAMCRPLSRWHPSPCAGTPIISCQPQ